MAHYIIVFLGIFGGFGLPMGMPPGEEDVRMYQAAPDDALLYACWSGVRDPEADANPTEKWLAQKEIADSRKKVRAALFAFASADWTWRNTRRDVPAEMDKCVKMIFFSGLKNPTAVYFRDARKVNNQVEFTGAAIVNMGDAKWGDGFDAWNKQVRNATNPAFKDHKLHEINGHAHPVIRTDVTPSVWTDRITSELFFTRHEDLAIVGTTLEEVEATLENLKTPAPKWLVKTRKELAIEQVASTSYLSTSKLRKIVNEREVQRWMGLGDFTWDELVGEIDSVATICGINQLGAISRTKLNQSEAGGKFLAALGGKPLIEDELGAIGKDDLSGLALRTNGKAVLEILYEGVRGGRLGGQLKTSLAQMEEFTGNRLEDEFKKSIGDFISMRHDSILFGGNQDWRIDIAVKEVMTFPAVVQQFSEEVKKLVEENELGKVTKSVIGNDTIYNYTHKYRWYNMAWALIDDRIVFGGDDLEKLIVKGPPKKADRLSMTKPFQDLRALGKAGNLGEPIGVFVYDLPGYVEQGASFIDSIRDQDTNGNIVNQYGVEFSLQDLPPAKFWHEGCQPHIAMMYRVDDGLIINQSQTYPGSSMMTTVAAVNLAYWLADAD